MSTNPNENHQPVDAADNHDTLVPVSKEELLAVAETLISANVTHAVDDEPEPAEERVLPEKNWIAPNVTMDSPTIVEAKDVARLRGMPLYTLRTNATEVDEHIRAFPNFKVQNDARGNTWWNAFKQAGKHIQSKGVYEATVARESAEWAQRIEYENLKLSMGKPPAVNVGKAGSLVGEQAIQAIQNAMGLGTQLQVPLWHSGVWVTLSTPTDAELLNLERRIQDEKISLGRDTSGALFSNNMVYIIKHVYNFILEHVYSVTMEDYTPERFSSILRVTDMQTLIHAMACSIYPNGYEHGQPCTIHPDKCQHVTKDWINLTKMFWTDRTRLTKKQVKHMANRVAQHKLEDIVAYQEEGKIGDGRLLEFDNDVKMVLRIPTIEQYVTSGTVWVEEVVDLVERIMTTERATTDKNDYIAAQARLVTLRQYGHWIKSVSMGDAIVLDEPELINDLLNRLSASDTIVDKFLADIKVYVEEATMSIVAIPSYKCPGCQGTMSSEETKHPHLIPVDALITFFTLRDHRTLRARMS